MYVCKHLLACRLEAKRVNLYTEKHLRYMCEHVLVYRLKAKEVNLYTKKHLIF
jgi:hypothetical protein